MEFDFNINLLLPDEITVVDCKLSPFKSRSEKGFAELKKDLSALIDAMGIASSKAQGLRGVITNAKRLAASNQRLYIIKDPEANNAKGSVVGIIKVGHKRLFVVDIYSQQLEVNPLCVLDFYVHERKQRSGYGLRLFKKMLEKENVRPQFLAFDRPSSKFLNFLKKHFELQNIVNQMNNYVVFDTFFRDLAAVGYVPKNRRFVSSAPIENRQQSYQEKRQIFSANLSGRVGSASSISRDNRFMELESCVQENSNVSSILPPRPPGRQGRFLKDVSWYRRNASNLSFCRNNIATESSTRASNAGEIDNIFSRHASFKDGISNASITNTSRPSMMSFPSLNRTSTILPTINNISKGQASSGLQRNSPTTLVNGGAEQKATHPRSEFQAPQSYSVNHLYRQATSIATSGDTAWNLFGVHLNTRNGSSNAPTTKQKFFQS